MPGIPGGRRGYRCGAHRAWQSDRLPIYEPGLDEAVWVARGRNLLFDRRQPAIAEADIIFVSVNTPTKTFGEGAGKAADLQFWEKTARQILKTRPRPRSSSRKARCPCGRPRRWNASWTSRDPTAYI